MADVLISRARYEALLTAALSGNTDEVERIQELVDADNGIKRYYLYVRWQDIGVSPPARIELGKGWPETQQFLIKMDRKITRDDVDTVLTSQAVNAVDVMVTPDKNGVVGWTLIDNFDFNS